MRVAFLTILYLAVFTPVLSAQTDKTQAILDLELTRFKAMISRDTLRLSELLSDDLIYIHSNALMENKTEHIRSVSGGKIQYHHMNREEAQARRYHKIAITNGIVKVDGILNGAPFDVRLRYTAVYQLKRRHWQLLRWQTTRI